MSIFAVTYLYSDDVELRDAERASHRAYLAALDALVVCGPWGVDEAAGALLLLRAGSADEVRALLEQDPFVKVGVVVEQSVREWLPVLGPATAAFEA